MSITRKSSNSKSIKKSINKKTKKMKKADCILGSINKNGLRKNNHNNYKNDVNCLIFGHKPCLLNMEDISKTIKIKLQQLNTKIYKNVIYIYPRFKKTAILCNEISNNYIFFKPSLELEGKTDFNKYFYILGYLLGYRDNEIRGFFLRNIAFEILYKEKLEKIETMNEFTLEKLVEKEIKKINRTEFNTNYKELKTICNKWLKMALGKNSIYNDLYIKAEKDIKLLEI
jgi:hypothetical protein